VLFEILFLKKLKLESQELVRPYLPPSSEPGLTSMKETQLVPPYELLQR